MITAAEARKLAGPTIEEKVQALLVKVEELAKQGKRQLRGGYDYDADSDIWVMGGYEGTPDWQKAKKILEGLGYKVEFYYNDSSMAADLYTIIKW